MDEDAKKTALRMIPYGIYVATADDGDGNIAAATVNWVTQTAFAPPLLVMGVKTDSGLYAVIGKSRQFVLNMLGKGQQGLAFTFFKPAEVADGTISGEAYAPGAATGAPVLASAPAHVECKVVEIVEQGDHHIVVGEVIGAGGGEPPGWGAGGAKRGGEGRGVLVLLGGGF
ncbi:MAG: flavin reductase family protein, partial [Alphaproteobacteria bacterium]